MTQREKEELKELIMGMATKISELGTASSISDSDLIPIIRNSAGAWVNQKSTIKVIIDAIRQNISVPKKISELDDVTVTSPQANQVLQYTNGTWINKTLDTVIKKLEGLDNVNITSPANGHVLTYENNNWVNKPSQAGVTNLADLNDTNVSSPSAGQMLIYENNKWANKNPTIAGLTDTTIASPNNGQALVYENNKWINKNLPACPQTLAELGDTTITTPSENDTLQYQKGKWVNVPAGGGGTSNVHKLNDLEDVNVPSPAIGQILKWNGSAWVVGDSVGGTWDKMSEKQYKEAESGGQLSNGILYVLID